MAKKGKTKKKPPKLTRGGLLPGALRGINTAALAHALNSDLGRRILADVLVAAAGAAAAAIKRPRHTAPDTGNSTTGPFSGRGAASEDHDGVYAAAGEVGSAMTEAVRYIFPAVPHPGEGAPAVDRVVGRKKRTRDKRLHH